jgi:hypothetical protein
VALELRLPESAGDRYAARSYSWISTPRTLRRRIRVDAGSLTRAVMLSRRQWSQVPGPVRGVLVQDQAQVPQSGD